MTRICAALAGLAMMVAVAAGAHQLNVFASVDCEAVTIEAKFSNGKFASSGEVRVLDEENTLLTSLELGADGTLRVPLETLDHSGGLVFEVETGSHDGYWIVTPEDIARSCGS
ncbi:MAG: hypothetical protein AAF771_10200 [Pseudomonadota bacterium]